MIELSGVSKRKDAPLVAEILGSRGNETTPLEELIERHYLDPGNIISIEFEGAHLVLIYPLRRYKLAQRPYDEKRFGLEVEDLFARRIASLIRRPNQSPKRLHR